MAVKRRKTTKPRTSISERELIDQIERKHWPEIEKKLAASRVSAAKGKVRKWNLDRFLAEFEKRRRSKLAAE